MTALVLVYVRIGLAAVFAIAGAAKLADRQGAGRAAREFGLGRFAPFLAATVPFVELALAATLVPASSARFAAIGAALLLAAFAIAIAIALAHGRRPDCHCFGKLHSSAAGPGTLLRNAGLAALAMLVATRPAPRAGWVELASSGVALLVAVQSLLAFSLLRRYGRALRRIEELETGVERPAVLAAGDEAPDFTLPRLAGGEVTLRGLLAPARSLLLLFVDPTCAPCHELVPQMGGWLDERITPVFISGGELDANGVFAEYGEVVLQREREVAELYGADATPSAILIGPDGRIEQPLATGRAAIQELVTVELAVSVDASRDTRTPAVPAVPPARFPRTAAIAAGGTLIAAAPAGAANRMLRKIDGILTAAEPRLAAAAARAAKAVRAQATLATGSTVRAKQAAARKALEAERRQVLAVRTTLSKLTLGTSAGRDAINARTFAMASLDLFAQSLRKQESAIGASPKVALALLDESRILFQRSLDVSALAARLLGRVP